MADCADSASCRTPAPTRSSRPRPPDHRIDTRRSVVADAAARRAGQARQYAQGREPSATFFAAAVVASGASPGVSQARRPPTRIDPRKRLNSWFQQRHTGFRLLKPILPSFNQSHGFAQNSISKKHLDSRIIFEKPNLPPIQKTKSISSTRFFCPHATILASCQKTDSRPEST